MKPIYNLSILIMLLSACSDQADKVIDMDKIQIVYSGHIYFEGNVDGNPGNFVFDTGCDILFLDSTFYNSNDFPYNSFFYDTISGIGNNARVIKFIYDSVKFRNHNLSYSTKVAPVMDLKKVTGDYIDGIIGTSCVKQKILELNFEKEYLKIHSSIDSVDVTGCKSISMNRINHYYCIPVEISVNDSLQVRGNFILDTGCPVTIISNSIVSKYNFDQEIDHKVLYTNSSGGLGGKSSGYHFNANGLKIGNFSFDNINMKYSMDSSGVLSEKIYKGILGNDILERFNMFFDFKNDIVYLKPNEKYQDAFEPEKNGFIYTYRCNTAKGWIVTGIYENSNAEKAGLSIGDTILYLNEKSVHEINFKQYRTAMDDMEFVRLGVKRSNEIEIIEFERLPLL